MTEIFNKTPTYDGKKSKRRRKRVMRTFKLNEIAAVDFGAQEPAKSVLIKRKDGDEGDKKKKKVTGDKKVEKMLILTSLDDDHQHILDLDMYAIKQGGGYTSYASGAVNPDTNNGHGHPYIINSDGSIIIAADHGHSHTVELGELAARLRLTMVLSTQEAVVDKKLEYDKEFVASDFALVPDVTDPTTWKYRLVKRSGSNPDRRLVGNVVAALKRGKVPQDECATVIRRVRDAWQKAHIGKTRADMPSVLKRAYV